MSDEEFEGWVALHRAATGASDDAERSLVENRATFAAWAATPGELGECTHRLMVGLRVPRFANEHVQAVGRELLALRAERDAFARPDHSDEYYETPRCPLCGGDGLVTVPLPKCVWQGRLVCFPGTRVVRSGPVLCDEPQCVKGRKVRDEEGKRDKPRPTYTAYCRRFGGIDLAGMQRQYERGLVTAAEKLPADPKASAGIDAALESIKAKVAAREAGRRGEDVL